MKRLPITLALFCFALCIPVPASAAVSFSDHGGYKMGAHKVHVIWWNAKPFSSSYRRSVHSLFQDVARDSGRKTNLYSLLAEYKIPYQVSWGGASSGSVPIPQGACPKYVKGLCAGRAQMDALLKNQIKINNLQSGLNHFYMVMLPKGMQVCMKISIGNACNGDYWSGLHSVTWDGSKSIIWGIVTYDSYMNGVDNNNAYDTGLAWILFHEHLEAITDPFGGSGWIAPGLLEIADLCEGSAWQKQKIGMHTYTVPALWSNRLNRCAFHA